MSHFPILNAKELLLKCGIDPALNEWRPLAGVDNNIFDALFLEPLYRYAEAVQLAPASESHHHSGPGGLLVHTIEVVTLALKKRRGYQLPLGGSIHDINEQRHAWTYGVFVACLLHDMGKLSANIRLVVRLKDGTEKKWTPHDESLVQSKAAKSYRIQFEKSVYEYHHKIALTHFDVISRGARGWLAQAPSVMTQLCSYLWGDRFESGIIGEIAEFADRESTARNLQIPSNHKFSNAISAIDRYLKMMRQWIADGALRVNVNGGMGWVDSDGYLYVVCRSLAEKMIQECESLGIKSLPQDPVRIYDILQEHGFALPTPDGKAIWNIHVKTETFEHKFTCLKFEARKFTPPTKLLRPLDGVLTVQDSRALEPATKKQATTPHVADEKTHENISGGKAVPQGTVEEKNTHEHDIEDANECQAPEIKNNAYEEETPEDAGASEENEAIEENLEAVRETERRKAATEKEPYEPVEENDTGSVRTLNIEAHDTPKRFVHWLKKGLIEKTILINDVTAEVHIVEEGVLLLAPAIFKTFLNTHGQPGESKHNNLSKRFARLRLHIRNGDVNIHSYWVCASNRASKINGWLLPFNIIYEAGYSIPKPNKYIRKNLEANAK